MFIHGKTPFKSTIQTNRRSVSTVQNVFTWLYKTLNGENIVDARKHVW